MGIEGFAEAARALLPDWTVVAIEDVELLAPFKFYRDEPRVLELRALVRDGGDGTLLADCRLIGRRELPGQGEQETRPLHRPRAAGARGAGGAERGGPAGRRRRRRATTTSTACTSTAPPTRCSTTPTATTGCSSAAWPPTCPPTTIPPQQPTEIAPRLIELCFQTAGVWELGTAGRMALPTHVDRVLALRRSRRGRDLRARAPARRRRRGRHEGRRRRRRRARAAAAAARGLQHDRPAGRRRAGRAASRSGSALAAAAVGLMALARPFQRLAIVNRGEPAMRLIHAVRELNAAGEHADPHDRPVHRPGARGDVRARGRRGATASDRRSTVDDDGHRRSGYLDFAALERALVATRADAAWVGWGFVAEDPAFAELCERLGIVFVGPDAAVMRRLGDKIEAKRLAERGGRPGRAVERRARRARSRTRSSTPPAIGFPLMIKAAAGGGGRGIRRVDVDRPSAGRRSRAPRPRRSRRSAMRRSCSSG